MFFAEKRDINSTRLYLSLLNDLLEQGTATDDKARIFKSIIYDAKSVIDNEKNYYKISRNIYPIVVYLANEHADAFSEISKENITTENLKTLKGLLEEAVAV